MARPAPVRVNCSPSAAYSVSLDPRGLLIPDVRASTALAAFSPAATERRGDVLVVEIAY